MSIFSVEIQLIVPRLGWTLIHSLWQGMLVAAVLMVVLRAMSDARARVRYFTSCAALALVLFSAITTYWLLGGKVQPPMSSDRPIALPMARVAFAAPSALPPVVSASLTKSTDHEQMMRLVVLAWGMGVVLVSAWHLFGWASLWRLSHGARLLALEPTMARLRRELKIRQVVRLIETTRLNVPAVVGAFRPIILLPIGLMSELTPQQIEAILLHELAHIARHDYLVNLLQAAIEALMFYHPAVWWISSQIRREREHCCDDVAAGCCNTRVYAETLLALEQRRMPTGMLALGATDGILLSRVRRLLKVRSGPTHRPVRSLATALLLLGCLGLPFVAVAQQKPPAAPVTRPVTDQGSNTAAAGLVYSEILPEDLKPVEDDYRLGAKDKFQISITGPKASDTVKQMQVAIDELVRAASLRSPLKIEGMTAPEAEKAILKVFAEANVGNGRRISVQVLEARGWTFSVLGQVNQPGQYTIYNVDLRLSTALSWPMAGAHLKDNLFLTVIRAAPAGQKHRALNIPIAKLYAGDPNVDVVIRSGDMILVTAEPEAGQQAGQSTTAPVKADAETGGNYYLAGLVLRSGVYSIPARRINVKQAIVSAGIKEETNNAYFTVIRRSNDDEESFAMENARFQDVLSGKEGELYIHDNDIINVTKNPVPPRVSAAQALSGDDEYYIGGEVQRVGVYSLDRRKVNILQAVMSAGGPVSDIFISVIRRTGKGREDYVLLMNARIEDLISGKQPEIYLQANDIVMVSKHPERVAATQAAPTPVRSGATTQSATVPGGAASETWDPPQGLEFLRTVPELRGVSLRMSEKDFLELVKARAVSVRSDLSADQISYNVSTDSGENVIVMFRGGTCSGIQRMRPSDSRLKLGGVAATQAVPMPVRGSATTQGMILPAPTDGTAPGQDFVFRADGNSLVVSLPNGKTFIRDRYTVKKEGEREGGAATTFTAVDGEVQLRIGGVLAMKGTELHYGPKGALVAATQPAR